MDRTEKCPFILHLYCVDIQNYSLLYRYVHSGKIRTKRSGKKKAEDDPKAKSEESEEPAAHPNIPGPLSVPTLVAPSMGTMQPSEGFSVMTQGGAGGQVEVTSPPVLAPVPQNPGVPGSGPRFLGQMPGYAYNFHS